MEKITATAELLKALSEERRLEIIDLLACSGKLCVCDITDVLGLSQPNISHHLKVLKEVELITASKHGRWVHYRLNHDKLEELQENLDFIIAKQSERYDFTKSDCY